MKRISRQMDEEMKMKLCDFVITNNDQQLVIPQVMEIHKKFMNANSIPLSPLTIPLKGH